MKSLLTILLILLLVPVTTISAAKPTPTPTVKSVCIDPGHGGFDSGTSNNGLTEKALNLDVANRLADLLSTNYTVYQTRTTDLTLSNNDRYTFCNNKKAAILVSVHHNGSTDPTIDYSQALYMKKTDVDLANTIVGAVSSNLNTTNNGISRFASGVLLKANMPATISEGFFLTNSTEYNLLQQSSSDRRQAEANALAIGIDNYFSAQP